MGKEATSPGPQEGEWEFTGVEERRETRFPKAIARSSGGDQEAWCEVGTRAQKVVIRSWQAKDPLETTLWVWQ